MDGEKVADICLHKQDFSGERIEAIYSKVSGTYAVYGTPKRVMVQFCDDPQIGAEQRRALAPLHPLRGQIDGLLDTWRNDESSPRARGNQTRVRIFDRRTADALAVALQGDQAHARTLLEEVKQDILEEQMSMGRVDYLMTATYCAVAVFVAFFLLSVADSAGAVRPTVGSFIALNKIWLAAGFGSLGALFSIALGIRSRGIRPDLQRRDNFLDATLRIMIGVVSAVVLFSLLRSQLVSLGFGGNSLDFAVGNGTAVHLAIIVAFVAGFSERLVGDYLTRATLDDRRTSPSAASAQQQATREAESHERNPLGRRELNPERADTAPGRGATPATVAPANDPGQPNDEDGTDACACDLQLAEEEVTVDDELPEATGGIDKAA